MEAAGMRFGHSCTGREFHAGRAAALRAKNGPLIDAEKRGSNMRSARWLELSAGFGVHC